VKRRWRWLLAAFDGGLFVVAGLLDPQGELVFQLMFGSAGVSLRDDR
jgi:hypothetical protein